MVQKVRPDEKILNRTGVTEPSGVCFDQLLMRAAAAAAEDDDRAQSKGCWEGNRDQADVRETDKQGLGGKRCFASTPKGRCHSSSVAGGNLCPLWNSERGRLESYVSVRGKMAVEGKKKK